MCSSLQWPRQKERVRQHNTTDRRLRERQQSDKQNPGCQMPIVLNWMCFCHRSIQPQSRPVYDNQARQASLPSSSTVSCVRAESAQHDSKHPHNTCGGPHTGSTWACVQQCSYEWRQCWVQVQLIVYEESDEYFSALCCVTVYFFPFLLTHLFYFIVK